MALLAAGWSFSSGACHCTRPEVVPQTYDAGYAETTSKSPSLDGGTEQPVREYMASKRLIVTGKLWPKMFEVSPSTRRGTRSPMRRR